MRKILLTAACLFVATQASAVSLRVNRMEFWDATTPVRLYGLYTDPTVTGFVNLSDATGELQSSVNFFGVPWTATVKWTATIPGAYTWSGCDALPVTDTYGVVSYTCYNYTFTLAAGDVAVGFLFDWSTNIDIPVLTVLRDNDDGTWGAVDQVWYNGTKTAAKQGMQTSPFPGQWPKFTGVTDEPPVITLTGSDPVILTVGVDLSYDDAGATAADTEDGNLTADITVGGFVDVGFTGTYVITYDVDDSTGQPATQLTRTVFVNDPGELDVTPPVITLLGNNPLEIELNGAYVDPGVTAVDNIDGVITGSVVVGGDEVDTSVPGNYIVTYNVSDTAENPATQVTRTVTVLDTDTTPPVITLTGANYIELTQGDTWTDPGYSATDDRDGVITGDVVKSGQTVDTSEVDTYTIIYNVSDEAGNAAAEKTRIVKVLAPTCAVRGAVVNNFTMYTNEGNVTGSGSNTVWFNWDGSLLTESDVDPDTHMENVPANAALGTDCKFFGDPWFADPVWIFGPGTYTFDACPAGDGSTQCTPGEPENLITLEVGEDQIGSHMLFSWGPSNHIDMLVLWDQNDVYHGLMAQGCGGANANKVWDLVSIDIDGDGIPGFPFVDGPFGGFSGNLNMMRPDSEAVSLPGAEPVLEIQGDNPLALEMGDTFTCPSAMAEDQMDGPICDQVTSAGCDDVNTSVPGAYNVTYQVVDNDGNKVSHDLQVIVFGPAADVPEGNLAGANPLVTFGETADHPVIIMEPALDPTTGEPQDLPTNKDTGRKDTAINVMPCSGRDCASDFGFDICSDPGATALDRQDGAVSGDNLTTTIEKLVAGEWVEAELDCSKPARYRITYTASDTGEDNGLVEEAGLVHAAVAGPVYTTESVRYFNVNAIPTADEQLPAEQSENADVGGGCSASNGQNNPLQRADLLLVGGFLAVLGLRRVKRSDV